MNATANKNQDKNLLSEFPPVGYDQWLKTVETELKGAPFEKKMFKKTPEGITLKPIYCKSDIANLPQTEAFPGSAPFVRGTCASGYTKWPWAISQELTFSSPTEFNHAARTSVSKGLNALNIVVDKATRNGHDPDWALPEEVGFGGLSIATLHDLERALEGVDLKTTSLFIRSGASGLPFAALVAALVQKRKTPLADLHGCIEMDPLGVLAGDGSLPQSIHCAYREMAILTQWSATHAPSLQTICVHSRAWHESGANAIQELAYTLAVGAEYLRAMHERNLDVDLVAPRMRVALTVGPRIFVEIAKIRALRLLWGNLVAAVGGSKKSQKIALHIRTAQRSKTGIDPYNNLVRSTVEALAGVLGGCDSMQVGAFDEVLRPADDFSRRLARNTQLILQKECQLDHVCDPAGGSYYIEALTNELATKAWVEFQEIEAGGGMETALRSGIPQKAIAAVAAEKTKAVNGRRDSIVGINQYANPLEKLLDIPKWDKEAFHKRRVSQVTSHRTSFGDAENDIVLEKLAKVIGLTGDELFTACADAMLAGATLGEVTRLIRLHDKQGCGVKALALTRPASSFEKLRKAMACHSEGLGCVPKIFLCNMGTVKEHKARADFARSFFSAGGFDVISPEGFKTVEAATQAFVASRCHLAVICSTDENYTTLVEPLCKAIHEVNPDSVIVLAGYPQEQIENFTKAGVEEFIHVRADAVEVLTRIHAKLGVLS